VPETTSFSEWLHDIIDMRAESPFLYDNHVRPMADIVPEGATVFHMEHGLDALVPWFDALTGGKNAPRALPRINDRGAYRSVSTERARPTEADLAIIAQEYAEDFKRFGYSIGDKAPMAPAPTLAPDLLAERDAALKSYANPIARLTLPHRAVLSVTGSDGYISPDWYGATDQVPTWNYVAVHLRGTLHAMPADAMRDLLARQSAAYEERLWDKAPWTMDKMTPEVLDRMLRQILPFRLKIDALHSTWKLGQNKPDALRHAASIHVATGLGSALDELADLMRNPPPA